MSNPTEPYSPDEIAEGVEQARDFWKLDLTDEALRKAWGHWLQLLLARIDEVELIASGQFRELNDSAGWKQELERLTAEREVMLAALTRLAQLGGRRSEGNSIAQRALRDAGRCPMCGSADLATDEAGLEILTCKCGWSNVNG